MIPKATGWQYLRALSLDAIPLGARVFYTRATPLHEWRRAGAYTVGSCTKKRVVLDSAGLEIGTALLSDVEYLLDHAAEHRAVLHDAMAVDSWHSPAWTVVTVYYWAFFCALALTRLTGRSVWFLDRLALAELRQLAGAVEQPGAGALFFELGSYNSSTNRDLSLRPSQKQFHDAVWKAVEDLTEAVLAACDQSGNPLEFRLWSALKTPMQQLGISWPSDLRNAVNYRAGYAYREVIRKGEIDIVRFLNQKLPANVPTLVNELEDLGFSMNLYRSVNDDVRTASRLLGCFAVLMSAVVEALHREVIDRQKGDARWSNMRSDFIALRCESTGTSEWPFLP